MSAIPSYAELRKALNAAAEDLAHPTKVLVKKGVEHPHRFGRVVYFEGGRVGGCFEGKYLMSKGESHDVSVFALAHHLGLSPIDLGVRVEEIGQKRFYDLLRGAK